MIKELPFQIKQATDGLNDIVKIAYSIADLNTMNVEGRRTPDHTRIAALNTIATCIEKKLEILTSQSAVEAAMRFVDSTKKSQMVQDYKSEVDRIAEQDKHESFPIMDAVMNENVNIVTINDSSIDYNNNSSNNITLSDSDSLEEQEAEDQQEEQDKDTNNSDSSDDNNSV